MQRYSFRALSQDYFLLSKWTQLDIDCFESIFSPSEVKNLDIVVLH